MICFCAWVYKTHRKVWPGAGAKKCAEHQAIAAANGTGADCGSGRAPAGSVARCGSRFAACAAGPDRRSSVLCAVGGCCRSDRIVFDRYEGDGTRCCRRCFLQTLKSHHVKDLMRLLRENNLPAEGFVFDTALAAYLLDATAGSYELERLFVAYYFNEELPQPLYREKGRFFHAGRHGSGRSFV